MNASAMHAGVIGWPAKHSLSPKLHRYWLDRHGINGDYTVLDTPPEKLEETVRTLPEKGWRGVNITVPYKQEVMAYLDEIEDAARVIGAVNTIVVQENGALHGTNTDAYGFIENLKVHADLDRFLDHAVVLGAGGGARAVVWGLLEVGVKRITLAVRDVSKANSLLAFSDHIEAIAWNEAPKVMATASMLVNTTPLGMDDQPPLNVDIHALPVEALVTDLVYAPLHTPLLRDAQARGNIIIDGLGMLIYQAVPGFAAWFGPRPDVPGNALPALKKILLS